MFKRVLSGEVFVSFIGGLGFFSCGASAAWVTCLLFYFRHSHFKFTSAQVKLLVNANDLGCLVFCVPGSFLADVFGRRPVLLSSGPMFAVSWASILIIPNTVTILIVKFFHGALTGIVCNILTLYVAEISNPKTRGSLICQTNTWWHLGTLYVYIMALYFEFEGLTWSAIVPCLIFSGLMFLCPESPYYLLTRNKHGEAEKIVAWLRRGTPGDPNISQELILMSRGVKEDETNSKGAFKSLIFTREGRKALAVVTMLTVVCALVGCGALPTFVSDTLSKLSGDLSFSKYMTVIVGALTALVTIPSILLSDRLGRRTLLIASTVSSFIFFSITAVFFYIQQETAVKSSIVEYASYVCLVVGMCFNTFGIETLLGVAVGEFFSTSNRTIPSGLSCVVYTIAETCYQFLYETLQAFLYVNIVICASFSLLGAVGIYFFMPETKGKTFAEIQSSL